MSAVPIPISSPVKFQGAYVVNVNSNMGLSQDPSTLSLTVVEDELNSPQVLFTDPTVGEYKEVEIGSNFRFCGIITKYERTIAAEGGRTIAVEMSDPREIMGSIPIILAPGFRGVVAGLSSTGCALIDALGAFDDFDNTGFNLSDWNQSGMTFGDIILALKGGTKVIAGRSPSSFDVEAQIPTVFGEQYLFDLSEIEPLINTSLRINTNLISMADFIQELATSNAFDWYVDCDTRSDGVIVVTIKPINRSTDNTDIDLDNFLATNSGLVINARRGFELRNELACSVLVGAPVESLRQLNINGMANNPIDLSDEGGDDRYFMTEEEMRVVLGTKLGWESWVEANGDLDRYGITDIDIKPLSSIVDDGLNQLGRPGNRLVTEFPAQEKRRGQLYEKLKGHAQASYGKRFLFPQVFDVDYVDGVWTADVVAGNDDANEYFRDNNGKTRAYVEFVKSEDVVVNPAGAIGSTFVAGKGQDAAQPLDLAEANNFDPEEVLVELDKTDYIFRNDSLFVSATIEEGNIVRIDAPVTVSQPEIYELEDIIKALKASNVEQTSEGDFVEKRQRDILRHDMLYGGLGASIEIHAAAYQPKFVYIPTRAKYLRYGPVFSSNISSESEGRLEIIQDDGFAPWEFGGFTTMLDAMQFKVDNQSSSVKQVETADIDIVGLPLHNLGDSLGLNSNINNINITFGPNGINTNYRLQSFARRFGQLSKEQLAFLSLFARRSGGRTLPQDTVGFIERFRTQIPRQLGGRGASLGPSTTGGAKSFE